MNRAASATGGGLGTIGFALYLLFCASWFIRLPARVPALATIRFDMLLVAVIALFAVLEGLPPAGGPPQRRTQMLLFAIPAYVLVTLPLVTWPGSVLRFGLEGLAKALVFYFFSTIFLNTRTRLAIFFARMAAGRISAGMSATKP